MKVYRILWLMFALLVASSSSAFSGESVGNTTYPVGCHALSFKGTTFSSIPSYSQFKFYAMLPKIDIVCFGDSITIDTPVYTNGGDVAIYANTLRLRAIIDTRPYFEHSDGVDHFEDPPQVTRFNNKVSYTIRNKPQYIESYLQYYTSCFDCRKSGDSVLIPELPSGLTPFTEQGSTSSVKDGFGPPDANLDLIDTRAGSIHLYIHDLEIASSLRSPSYPQEPPVCNQTVSSIVPFALNAGGARGGRGGAGTPSPCVDHRDRESVGDKYVFDCVETVYQKQGGLNAPGGRGGDAGSIVINLIENAAYAETAKVIEEVSNVRGGEPGPSSKLRTPASEGSHAATGSLCDFSSEGLWSSSTRGQDGLLSVLQKKPTEALVDFVYLIKAKDGRPDYDLIELAKRAENDLDIRQVTNEHYWAARLVQVLGSSAVSVASDLDLLLAQGITRKASYSWPILEDIDLEVVSETPLEGRTLLFLRELATFSASGSNLPIVSYFLHSGGLLDIAAPDPFARFLAEATRVDVSRDSEILVRIRDDLADVSLRLADLQASAEGREFRDSIRELQRRLADAEAKAAQGSGSFFSQLVGVLGETVAAVTNVVAQQESGNLEGMAKGVPRVFDSGIKLLDIVSGAGESDLSQVQNLKEALAATEQAYRKFVEEAARLRDSLLQRRYAALVAALQRREAFHSKLESRYAQFRDLLGLAFVSYQVDPARDKAALRNNLTSIVTFLSSYPDVEPYFRFNNPARLCQEELVGSTVATRIESCVVLRASNSWRVVSTRTPVHGGSPVDLPLYVVAPTQREWHLPIYGLPVDVRVSSTIDELLIKRTLVGEPLSDVIGPHVPGQIEIRKHPQQP